MGGGMDTFSDDIAALAFKARLWLLWNKAAPTANRLEQIATIGMICVEHCILFAEEYQAKQKSSKPGTGVSENKRE